MTKYEIPPSSTTCAEGLPVPDPWVWTVIEEGERAGRTEENFNWADTFECPDCGHQGFEEIKVNVTTAGKVTCVDGTGELECDSWVHLGGFVARYECENCDYSLIDADGRTITDPYDLREYLIAQHRARKDAE
jgi:rubredoxin